MSIYMFSLFKAPKKAVCKPKKFGGLGVKDLFRFNDALLGKWKRKRLVEPDALWVRVVDSKYGREEDTWFGQSSLRDTFMRLYMLALEKQDPSKFCCLIWKVLRGRVEMTELQNRNIVGVDDLSYKN
ncbi:hypothetical protein Lal_00040884 [Lupinus albus]|nr:hypothetical protein Lal_00040884 [Lupinus albus]